MVSLLLKTLAVHYDVEPFKMSCFYSSLALEQKQVQHMESCLIFDATVLLIFECTLFFFPLALLT